MNLQSTFRQNNVNEINAGEQTISSLEIAEMVGREHKNIMRDILNIASHLGGLLKVEPTYFIESSYINSQNKEMPCFLLTKKGCELYGTRINKEGDIKTTKKTVVTPLGQNYFIKKFLKFKLV